MLGELAGINSIVIGLVLHAGLDSWGLIRDALGGVDREGLQQKHAPPDNRLHYGVDPRFEANENWIQGEGFRAIRRIDSDESLRDD